MLEAAKEALPEMEALGAATFVHVQNLTTSLPHPALLGGLLGLCSQAALVVADEPFVSPHSSLLETVERNSPVAVLRVDSSTLVPPRPLLASRPGAGKAWQWQERTKPLRAASLAAAARGDFDAVPLLSPPPLLSSVRFPGARPIEGRALAAVENVKAFALGIAGGGPAPCSQTDGGGSHGRARWASFLAGGGVAGYARKRNDPGSVFAVSRMSCYLNIGAVREGGSVRDGRLSPGSTRDPFMHACSLACSSLVPARGERDPCGSVAHPAKISDRRNLHRSLDHSAVEPESVQFHLTWRSSFTGGASSARTRKGLLKGTLSCDPPRACSATGARRKSWSSKTLPILQHENQPPLLSIPSSLLLR